ncbi:hypothetical protein Gohar_027768, partial [Gossypium harknessii]|nr:hypothetical protein [Gossypium harknessii]
MRCRFKWQPRNICVEICMFAMELALSLEKLTNEKLLNLHKVAERNHDSQLTDFIEGEFLAEQVESIKKISEYVAQLRRVGKGHGMNLKLLRVLNVSELPVDKQKLTAPIKSTADKFQLLPEFLK